MLIAYMVYMLVDSCKRQFSCIFIDEELALSHIERLIRQDCRWNNIDYDKERVIYVDNRSKYTALESGALYDMHHVDYPDVYKYPGTIITYELARCRIAGTY